VQPPEGEPAIGNWFDVGGVIDDECAQDRAEPVDVDLWREGSFVGGGRIAEPRGLLRFRKIILGIEKYEEVV